MSVKLKSDNSSDEVRIDPTSKAMRVTIYTSAGVEESPGATTADVAAVTTSLGTDGATPPSIPGTGVRGWLRSIYDAILARFGVLGQAAMAGSAPVVIASNQTAVPISGTVTANAGTGPFPVSDNSGSLTIDSPQLPAALAANGGIKIEGVASGVAVPVSGTFFQATQPVSGTVAATQSGTWTVQPGNTANTTAWKVDGSAVTQPTQDTSSLVDNAPFIDSSSRVLPAGFVFDESAGAALTENDIGAARVTANRAQVITIEDSTTRGQRASVSTDGGLSVTQVRTGTSTDINVAQNAASTTIAATNTARKSFTLTNTATVATLWLGEGTAAIVGRGVQVLSGTSISMNAPCTTLQINGIWSAAGAGTAVGYDRS